MDNRYDYLYSFNNKSSFLTNFNERDILQYKTAIYEYEKSGKANKTFWIEDKAYDCEGAIVSNSKALHVYPKNECSDFWEVFNSIRNDFPTELQRLLWPLKYS